MSIPYPLAQTAWSDSFVSVLPGPLLGADSPAEASGFKGRLDDISLPSLLQILELERKTGIVVLLLEPALEKAFLYLNQGRVFRARLSGRTEPSNAEAVHHLLGCRSGSFDFLPSDSIQGDEIRCSTTRLLFEGARRREEAPLPPCLEEKAGAASPTGAPKARSRIGRPLRRMAAAPSSRLALAKDAVAVLLMIGFALLVIMAALSGGQGMPDASANASPPPRGSASPSLP